MNKVSAPLIWIITSSHMSANLEKFVIPLFCLLDLMRYFWRRIFVDAFSFLG
jgi:hypothetical protein